MNNEKNNLDMKEFARQLGSRGGKNSVKKRFEGKTKEEISKMMSNVRNRLNEKEEKEFEKMAKGCVKSLNKSV